MIFNPIGMLHTDMMPCRVSVDRHRVCMQLMALGVV